MHIVFAASECVPYAKTGGVAEVVGALPKELVRQGHRVTVYVPLYRQVQKHLKERKIAIRSLTIPFSYYNRFATIVDGGTHRTGCSFISSIARSCSTGSSSTKPRRGNTPITRNGLGSSAAPCSTAPRSSVSRDVFHIHGWPAGVLAILLRTVYYFDPVLKNVACLLTIHNSDRQGWFHRETVEKLLLPWDVYTADRAEFYGTFDFLKGGIVYSDAINHGQPQVCGRDPDPGIQ